MNSASHGCSVETKAKHQARSRVFCNFFCSAGNLSVFGASGGAGKGQQFAVKQGAKERIKEGHKLVSYGLLACNRNTIKFLAVLLCHRGGGRMRPAVYQVLNEVWGVLVVDGLVRWLSS